ncbi:MAG: hypothetical protein KJ676_05880 [Alphaproteobacteria bacterium]|nr:hypothetical protein [Alphaproteobacteria bacterium]MBU1526993.1 hypothetical protein [Alphaproteobacteria bacterium]MBU2351988.1 hypothetical protein [Alphaproteobacteria bacterium]
MFEFGKDLRRLFGRDRDRDDLGWLELVGVELVEAEARRAAIDAGRASCAKPDQAWLTAAALWRELAARTGRKDALAQADDAARDAERAAQAAARLEEARCARAQALLLRFDLYGGPGLLDEAAELIARDSGRQATVAVHARISARQARLDGRPVRLLEAAALLDLAVHGLEGSSDPLAEAVRLDRAGLTLEAGIAQRDARLLDQAGRDLFALVESSPAERRPLTRARALALSASGLSALAALADDAPARDQARALLEAAGDQFTPDHSPLDWCAVQLVSGVGSARLVAVEALCRAAGPGLVLGSLARERLSAGRVAAAEAAGDLAALDSVQADLRRRVSLPSAPLDWAADQIGLARVALARARLCDASAGQTGLMLAAAAEVATEEGCPLLARQAEALLSL